MPWCIDHDRAHTHQPVGDHVWARGNPVTETAPAAVTHEYYPKGSLTVTTSVTGTTTYTYDA